MLMVRLIEKIRIATLESAVSLIFRKYTCTTYHFINCLPSFRRNYNNPCFLDIKVYMNLYIVKYGSEMSYSFTSTTGYNCDQNGFGGTGLNQRLCLLKPGTFTIYCKDSYGDGWHGGYIEILGNNYCTGFSTGKNDQGGPVEITWASGPGYHGMCKIVLNQFFAGLNLTFHI